MEKWSVNYYTEIKSLEIVKRIELLPEEAKNVRSGNEYYKITIGELKKTSLVNPESKMAPHHLYPNDLPPIIWGKRD